MGTDALTLDIAERIADVDGATWDVLARDDSIFVSRATLAAKEAALPANVRPRYVVVRRGPVPLFCLSCELIDVDGERVLPSIVPSGKGRRRRLAAALALEAVNVKLFVVGSYLSWGHTGVAFSPHVSPKDAWPLVGEALDLLSEKDDAVRDAEIALVLDVGAREVPLADALSAHGFEKFENEPDMVLDLDPSWRTYDDYLAALNTKYRKAARDMDKRLAESGCTLARLDDIDAARDALHALYRSVHERSPFRFVTAGPSLLPDLARAHGARFSVNVVRRRDEIVAFGSTLLDRDTAIAYLVGHDPDENGDLPLYLRLLLASVDDGVRMGAKRVAYGRTALEPKARVGAKPVPLTVYARHQNRVLHALVAPWLARLVPKGAPPDRSPFKSGAKSK